MTGPTWSAAIPESNVDWACNVNIDDLFMLCFHPAIQQHPPRNSTALSFIRPQKSPSDT